MESPTIKFIHDQGKIKQGIDYVQSYGSANKKHCDMFEKEVKVLCSKNRDKMTSMQSCKMIQKSKKQDKL